MAATNPLRTMSAVDAFPTNCQNNNNNALLNYHPTFYFNLGRKYDGSCVH